MFKVTARTVLELGSELISSDIIAFYELVKNAFDAGSTTGSDIHFRIALRRNAYLQVRELAVGGLPSVERTQEPSCGLLKQCIDYVAANLETSAGIEVVTAFKDSVLAAGSLPEFVAVLDECYQTHNRIEILDSGIGMSALNLTENFLVIGTPSRKRDVERVLAEGGGKTPYLGEKGIGRLSAMRLGDRLRIESARAEDDTLAVLDIDWTLFDSLEKMIEDVKLSPSSGGAKEGPKWHGTRLIIRALVEDWSERRVRELAGYEFARLTDPFIDPKKRPRIALHWNGTRVAIPWMDPALLEQCHASFRGEYTISDKGPELSVQMQAINLGFAHPKVEDRVTLTLPELEGLLAGTDRDVPSSALTSVGPFEFHAYWYNRRYLAGVDTIGNQKQVRELQRKWSGILLFRDGFRVFPYGDDEDDWLGLDRRALGRTGYVLNKAQFVGHVQITRAKNARLVDQTNREGLRANPEQQVFTSTLQHVVRDALWDFFREVERQYKKVPLDIAELTADVDKLENRARSALSQVRKLVPREELAIVEDLQMAFTEFREISHRARVRIEEVESESRQMIHMAGLGLMVEVVAHELARAAESAMEALEGLRGRDMPAEVKGRLETLRAEMKTVSKRLRVLDELSVSGRQRAEVFDLGEVLDDLKEGHAGQFQRHNIRVVMERPSGVLRVRLVKGMLVQILENLISNSVYWMKIQAARPVHYGPTITLRVQTSPFVICYSDNGPGISPDHREKIFRPFWSLKEKGKRRGLGLFIARENAVHLGATLSLSDASDPMTHRLHEFVLAFPSSPLVS